MEKSTVGIDHWFLSRWSSRWVHLWCTQVTHSLTSCSLCQFKEQGVQLINQNIMQHRHVTICLAFCLHPPTKRFHLLVLSKWHCFYTSCMSARRQNQCCLGCTLGTWERFKTSPLWHHKEQISRIVCSLCSFLQVVDRLEKHDCSLLMLFYYFWIICAVPAGGAATRCTCACFLARNKKYLIMHFRDCTISAAEKEKYAVNCACRIHPFENYTHEPWMFCQKIASSCFAPSCTATDRLKGCRFRSVCSEVFSNISDIVSLGLKNIYI